MYSEGGRAAIPLGGIVAVEAAELDKALLVGCEGEGGVPVLGDKLFKGKSRLFWGEVMVEDAQKIADILSRIAFDGIIDSTEQADFDKAIAFLCNLKTTVDDMLLIGAKAKKNGPRTTGNRSHAIGY